VAIILYVMGRSVPEEYRPPIMSTQERTDAAKQFYRKVMDFSDGAQSNEPFEWLLTVDQINKCLCSLDEIAALLPDGQSGEVKEMMESAGLSDPVAVLGDGCMTVMARAGRDSVVSVDVAMKMDEQGRLGIFLGQARIGRVPVPERLLKAQLEELKADLLDRRGRGGGDRTGGMAARLAGSAGAGFFDIMLATIDGKPFVPTSSWKGRIVRLEGLEITPNHLSLRVRATPKARRGSQTGSSRASTQEATSSPSSSTRSS
jgi:hypothetical protein